MPAPHGAYAMYNTYCCCMHSCANHVCHQQPNYELSHACFWSYTFTCLCVELHFPSIINRLSRDHWSLNFIANQQYHTHSISTFCGSHGDHGSLGCTHAITHRDPNYVFILSCNLSIVVTWCGFLSLASWTSVPGLHCWSLVSWIWFLASGFLRLVSVAWLLVFGILIFVSLGLVLWAWFPELGFLRLVSCALFPVLGVLSLVSWVWFPELDSLRLVSRSWFPAFGVLGFGFLSSAVLAGLAGIKLIHCTNPPKQA